MDGNVVGADAGEHHDERDQDLEESGEHESLLGIVDALCGESFLDDVLVESPVAQVGQPYAADDGRDPRHVGESLRRMGLLDDQMEV